MRLAQRLVHQLAYATDAAFEAALATARSDLHADERALFQDVVPGLPLILSEEGLTSVMLRVVDHMNFGCAVACPRQIARRLDRWAQAAEVEIEILLVERNPVDVLHGYYAQHFHLFRKIRRISTFEKYLDLGLRDDPMVDLGFRILKPGVLRSVFEDAGHVVRTIGLKDLLRDGVAHLPDWSDTFPTTAEAPKAQNVRSREKGVKITHLRPSWIKPQRPSVSRTARVIYNQIIAPSLPHSWIEVPIVLAPEKETRLRDYFADPS